jgi:hypothetical protein
MLMYSPLSAYLDDVIPQQPALSNAGKQRQPALGDFTSSMVSHCLKKFLKKLSADRPKAKSLRDRFRTDVNLCFSRAVSTCVMDLRHETHDLQFGACVIMTTHSLTLTC